jgi:hypothetical protein
MEEVHVRVYIHSIFYIHNQLTEIHNRIYKMFSYLEVETLSIFRLSLIYTEY